MYNNNYNYLDNNGVIMVTHGVMDDSDERDTHTQLGIPGDRYTAWVTKVNGGLSLALQLLHGRLVLSVHLGQLLPDAVVNIEELSDAAVDADSFALTEVCLVVLRRDALLVACSRQPVHTHTHAHTHTQKRSSHAHHRRKEEI